MSAKEEYLLIFVSEFRAIELGSTEDLFKLPGEYMSAQVASQKNDFPHPLKEFDLRTEPSSIQTSSDIVVYCCMSWKVVGNKTKGKRIQTKFNKRSSTSTPVTFTKFEPKTDRDSDPTALIIQKGTIR